MKFVFFFTLPQLLFMMAFAAPTWSQERTTPTAYRNAYRYPKNITLEVDNDLLGKCFARVALKHENLILPSMERYPQLTAYLMGSAVNYSTGFEPELKSFILAQPDNSVDPVMLFEKALDLNQGNIFNAVLTIHETLRSEARFYRRWALTPSTFEQMQKFFNKMIDIRGDLEERGNEFNGDHRGSWYRIWGMMLQYLKMTTSLFGNRGAPLEIYSNKKISPLTNLRASILASFAEKFKTLILYGKDVDRRKIEINKIGYRTLNSFIQALKTGQIPADLDQACAERKYLIEKAERRSCDQTLQIKAGGSSD